MMVVRLGRVLELDVAVCVVDVGKEGTEEAVIQVILSDVVELTSPGIFVIKTGLSVFVEEDSWLC